MMSFLCSRLYHFGLIAAAVLSSLMPVIAAQSGNKTTAVDPRVGSKVMVTKAGAELRTPQATVWRAWRLALGQGDDPF